jgi:6-phosphofructokinase 1
MIKDKDLKVKTLGKRMVPSPLKYSQQLGDGVVNYIRDETRIRYQINIKTEEELDNDLLFEKAGPREKIYFDPAQTKAAIVTCGGLCPGMNNVIRSIFLELHYKYNVPEIYGIRYGFKGLNPAHGYYPTLLTKKNIEGIQDYGGTVLGTSRGQEDIEVMVDTLDDMGVNILFCVGGDGTLMGAHGIHDEIEKRKKKISVIGVPKTIDNDISFVYKTFGFDTAVGIAKEALKCAHVEATGAPNGIGLVKVMGREAGFIAAHATLACLEVNFCLIPEVPFDLYGPGALMQHLEERLVTRNHAVIVVAEGAGQALIESDSDARDPSGNIVLKDIGDYLRDKIKDYFSEKDIPINLKYIEPSYIIRSVPANASDSIFCDNLARCAVHAGMAGKTDVLIGLWHGSYTHVPLQLAVSERKYIDPESDLWRSVIGATGQPISLKCLDG